MITFYADVAKTPEKAAREDRYLQIAREYALYNLETGVWEERTGFMTRYELREWVATIRYGNLIAWNEVEEHLVATSEM